MNGGIFIALIIVALEGAIMLLLPHFSPRRFLFAITVVPGFRGSAPGRGALRRYHWETAGATLVAAIAVVGAQGRPELAMLIAAFVPIVAGIAAFLRERSAIRRVAGSAPDVREAELVAEGDHLPWWFALVLPPFAVPAVAALILRAHWDEIPSRFPVHWGLNGPDRWADKTPLGVYGGLLFSAGMMLMLMLLTLAAFYGSRRTPQRGVILKIMVLSVYLLASISVPIGLGPLYGFLPWEVLIPLAVFLIIMSVWIYQAVADPKQAGEPTPDECWYLGQIYVNSEDPAIFVQRRIGWGYTLNLGNPWAWMILVAVVAMVLGFALVFRAPYHR